MNLTAGQPYSLIKHGLPYNYTTVSKHLKTEVVIMGGGISGALVAHYLTAQNISCVVVDARTIGLGSSCASTSMLQYEIDTPLHELKNMVGNYNANRSYLLCKEAIDALQAIAKEIKFPLFESRKSFYYAAYKKDIEFLKKEFDARQQAGFDVALLNQNEVQQLIGIDAPAAILSSAGAKTNAYMLAHYLHQYNIKRGLQVYDRSEITTIKHEKNGVKVTTNDGYTIDAKKMVYATGYEAVKYIEKKIVTLESTYAIVSERYDGVSEFWKDDMLLWNTADPYLYMRTTMDERIVVGGRDEDFYNPTRRNKLIEKKSNQLVSDFQKVFPAIAFKKELQWAGTFGSTKDGLPYIGTYKSLPHSYFALGFGGNGITFSLIAAQLITDLFLGNKNADLKIFSFER